MGKTSAAVKNRYASKAYDSLRIIVPKGRKDTVEAFVSDNGETINGYVNRLIREDIGISEDEWKRAAESSDDVVAAANVAKSIRDPNYTKVTPDEAAEIDHAEQQIANGEYSSLDSIDWDR